MGMGKSNVLLHIHVATLAQYGKTHTHTNFQTPVFGDCANAYGKCIMKVLNGVKRRKQNIHCLPHALPFASFTKFGLNYVYNAVLVLDVVMNLYSFNAVLIHDT